MVLLGSVFASPWGGGVPCLDLLAVCVGSLAGIGYGAHGGLVVARVWPSAGVGPPPAVPWSSPRWSPVRGPCWILAARGSGSPGAGCVRMECRNQEGLVVWCLGVLAHRLVGPGWWRALLSGRARSATSSRSAGWCVAASRAWCGSGVALLGEELLCVVGAALLHAGGGGLVSGLVLTRGRSPVGSGCRGLPFGRVFPGVSLVRSVVAPGRPAV